MDINITLFGEMLTFAVLIWVTMRYIWPPLMKAIYDRQQKIASGLEAALRGKEELALARANVIEQLRQTKAETVLLLNQASQQAEDLIAKSKAIAQMERDKILAQAQLDIKQEINNAKNTLQQQTADLVIIATEKMLQQKIDNVTQKKLIDNLIASV